MSALLECVREEINNQRELYDRTIGALIFAGDLVRETKIVDPNFFGRYCIQPVKHQEEILNKIKEEAKSEMGIRKGAVRDYIALKGLTKHQDEIIQGMNRTCKRVTLWDDEQEAPVLLLRLIAQHDNSALLDFAFDYVDRWKMYNELFGDYSEQ